MRRIDNETVVSGGGSSGSGKGGTTMCAGC